MKIKQNVLAIMLLLASTNANHVEVKVAERLRSMSESRDKMQLHSSNLIEIEGKKEEKKNIPKGCEKYEEKKEEKKDEKKDEEKKIEKEEEKAKREEC